MKPVQHPLAAAGAYSHVSMSHQRFYTAKQKTLHPVFTRRGFRYCVWVAHDIATKYHLVARGQEPTTVKTPLNTDVLYNLEQLIHLNRTASGKWFPLNFQRHLNCHRFKHKLKSPVWFRESQLGSMSPLPGEMPIELMVDAKLHVLFNTSQLSPPRRNHVLGAAGLATPAYDQFVLEHIAAKHGFSSTSWESSRFTGIKPDVDFVARVHCSRYGVIPTYNHDQLDWPIPIPEVPHVWNSGGRIHAHTQVVLQQAWLNQRFSSRQWCTESYHRHVNNVKPDATALPVDLGVPMGVVGVLNADQLVDAARFDGHSA
jgi:hypothetical protein